MRRGLVWAGLLAMGVLLVCGGGAPAIAGSGPLWWMVDTHEHSAFSGDARADIGLDASLDQSLGYNAVFLTDHDRGSSFQIQGSNGNYLSYSDALSGRWTPKPTGLQPVVSSPTHSGSSGALHFSVNSTTPTSQMVWAKRGPGLRSGDITLDFWVDPVTVPTSGAGADVSVSLGGDKTIAKPFGYTNLVGASTPGKSTVLVWELGDARLGTLSSSGDVFVSKLPYTLGVWNHYSIDVTTGAGSWSDGSSSQAISSTGINGLPAADQPADFAVLSQVKMEAATSTSGSANVYFDDFVLKSAAPLCPAAEFVYRNQLIDSGRFNTSSFVMYPAREMGQNNHTNQFNFDITKPSDYYDTYNDTTVPAGYGNDSVFCQSSNVSTAPWNFSYLGSSNITGTYGVQPSGYPAQTNHPGTTDSVNDVVQSKAHGSDLIEVRTGMDYSSAWDQLLAQDLPIIGTYGTDAHEGVGKGAPADFIAAPTVGRDDLLHSLFEGRSYMAPNNFGSSRIVFNLDPSNGTDPYPARYPVYVPGSQTVATVHLAISGGLTSGETVKFFALSNGPANLVQVPNPNAPTSGTTVPFAPTLATFSVTPPSFDQAVTVPLSGSFTYVRAAVYSSAGKLVANTQPIFFQPVAGLAAGTAVHVDSVTPASGCQCNQTVTRGIPISSPPTWNGSALSFTLFDAAGSTVRLLGTAPTAPTSVAMDGATVAQSATLADEQAAASDTWFYDAPTNTLYLTDKQGGPTSTVTVGFAATGVDLPPTVPANLAATPSGTTVNLSWSASSDNDSTPVAGYKIYRGGTLIKTLTGASSLTFGDTNVPVGTYSYTVSAYDSATPALESAQSTPVTATVTASTPLALVQDKTGALSTSGTSFGVPLAATASGDTLVAAIAVRAGSSNSVSTLVDSTGTAWSKGAVGYLTGTNSRIELWYRVGAPSVTSITITLAASGIAAADVTEWSGVVSTFPVDGTPLGGSNASATTIATPALTTTNAADVVIGAVNYPASATATLNAGGFTALKPFGVSTSVHGNAAYALTTSPGTVQPSWTLSALSGGSGGAILALKGSG